MRGPTLEGRGEAAIDVNDHVVLSWERKRGESRLARPGWNEEGSYQPSVAERVDLSVYEISGELYGEAKSASTDGFGRQPEGCGRFHSPWGLGLAIGAHG